MTKLSKNDILKKVREINDKAGLDKKGDKRVYRRRGDMPDPDQGHRSEINRTQKRLNARVSSEHFELFNKCAGAEDSARTALERAIELLAADLDLK